MVSSPFYLRVGHSESQSWHSYAYRLCQSLAKEGYIPTSDGGRSVTYSAMHFTMSNIEGVAPPAKLSSHVSLADLVRHISRLRIYQDYERAFTKTTKLPLELCSIDVWREVHRIRGTYTNPVCAILAEVSTNCAVCLEVRQKLAKANISDTQTVTCFAGLTYTNVPLKFYERVIGLLRTGQVFVGTRSARRFKKIATQVTSSGMKLNLLRLEDAYFRCRAVPADLYRATVRLLEIFAEHLSLIANQIALHEFSGNSLIVRRAKDYIAEHKFDAINLEQVARALNVSRFHFCRRFKLETGLTFVEYLSRLRLEQAKLGLQNKNLHVSEIAYQVGFQSLTHFNRTFRNLVGSSPTEYRSRLLGPTEEDFRLNEAQDLRLEPVSIKQEK
jgi:AraC-like DNA-binding protein